MTPAERTAWILRIDIDVYAKAVLHVLAHRADSKSGRCWPSMKRLAKEAGVSVRKARDVTRELQAAGLIDVSISIGKSTNNYVVKFGANPAQHAALEDIEPGTACRVVSIQPGTTRHSTRHATSSNPAQHAARTGNRTDQEQAAQATPSIWDLWAGLAGEPKRSFLGKQISEHGEAVVAAAVAEVSLKRPADPKSYLMGILKAKKAPEVPRASSPW